MAIYSKKNPDYVPSEEKYNIDFCYTKDNHLQFHFPYKVNGGTEYLVVDRVRQGDSYTYQIILRSNSDEYQRFELLTKEVNGKRVLDIEATDQTHLHLRDSKGNVAIYSINLNPEACQDFDKFVSIYDWGSMINRNTTELDGSHFKFLDTAINQNITEIRNHLRCAALTREYNSSPETPRFMTDPVPRPPLRLFEYKVFDPDMNVNRTIRNYMFPTSNGDYFNVEVDMSVPGQKLPMAYFKDAHGVEKPFVFDTRGGEANIVQRYGHTFVSFFSFEDIANPETTNPQPVLFEVPINGESLESLSRLLHEYSSREVFPTDEELLGPNGEKTEEAISATDVDLPEFFNDPELTTESFEAMSGPAIPIREYKPFIVRRALSDHEVAQLYPYTEDGDEKYLTIIQVSHNAEDGTPLPPTYDIVLADQTNGGLPIRHTLALEENGKPHLEMAGNHIVTQIQRIDGGIDEVALPLNPRNCETYDFIMDDLDGTFEESPTSCLVEDISSAPASEFDKYTAKSPQYELYNRKHAGSIRNLVSYEGEVGYLYLPTTMDNPPQYLRVMQQHGNLYINMNGLNPEKPEEATTCQILGVNTEKIDGRGNFLALDLSYGGKRHRITLPVRCDLENNRNTELFYDLQTLVRNGTIQLNHIQSYDRPEVNNFTYAADMERPIHQQDVMSSIKLGKQAKGTVARTGQNFEDLANDELSNYTFGAVTYTGLTQNVKLEGAPELGPQQKISIYNDQAHVATAEDGRRLEQHMLATVTRQRHFRTPDGAEKDENQTVFVVMEKQITTAEGAVRQGKTLLISANYLAEMQRKNPDFSITSGVTPNADGFYEFPVQKIQITANGELSYGIKVAGRDVGIATNARGSQIICQEGGVQRSAVLLNENSPMNIGFVTRILDEAYTEGTNVTIDPKSNTELIDNLLVQRIVLERREVEKRGRGPSDTVIEVGIPPESPKIRLYSAIVKQKSGRGKTVEQAVNFMLNEKNEVFVYAKIGGKAPTWTRVDRARLAHHSVDAEKKEGKETETLSTNPALVLASGKGVSEVTIPIEMDFAQNKEFISALNGTKEKPGLLHEAFDVETREGKKSQKAYFYQDGDADPSVHTKVPSEGVEYLPVYERTNQKTASVHFDTLANLQANIVEGQTPEESLPIPEKIEDPQHVDKPAEKEPDEWTPHPPMPNLRNCLIGGGLICVLLSVFIPGFAAVAILFAAGALMVEAQPWNAIGAARQKRLADAKKYIQDSHKQIEKQLAKVNEKFNEAKIELAKIEKQLANPNLKQSERDKLERRKAELQREIYKQQKAAVAVQTAAVVKARENLVEHQKEVIATHKREQQRKQREEYAKLRLQANEHDPDHETHRANWNSATEAERAEFAALSSRDESTLSEEEKRRLGMFRARFGMAGQVEASIAADESKDNEHLAQLEANLAKAEQEHAEAVAENAAAEATRDEANPPQSEWATITAENAGMANYNLREQTYDQPVAGYTASREEVENSPARHKKSGTFDRAR